MILNVASRQPLRKSYFGVIRHEISCFKRILLSFLECATLNKSNNEDTQKQTGSDIGSKSGEVRYSIFTTLHS